MNDAKQNKLQNGKISKLVLSYTLTTFIALLLNSIYTLADSLFVSWGVGADAMGGVSIVFSFVLIQSAISTALGGGAASIISRLIGNGKLEEAGIIVFHARVTFYITAILITVFGFIFMEPILKMLGATEELYLYAKDYYTIILLGNIFSTGFSAIIRAEGKMLYSLLIWVIPITLNIAMDTIFIFVLGWGIKGSAYSTVICQFISFSMSILFFAKFSVLKMKITKLNIKTIKEIFAMGLPSLVQTGTFSFSLLLVNNILKHNAGTLAINTFAYVNEILMFIILPFLAFMQAIGPIIGYNYGVKNFERIKKTIDFTLIIAVCYSLTALAILEVMPVYLLMLFTKDPGIIDLGTISVRITAISIPFMPFALILGAAYQAQGKKMQALLMFSANLIFLAIFEFAMTKAFGLNGAWWAYAIANALTALTSVIFYHINRKHNLSVKEKPI